MNHELARMVRAAIRRAFYCPVHGRRIHCEDCIIESRTGRQLKTLQQIMEGF